MHNILKIYNSKCVACFSTEICGPTKNGNRTRYRRRSGLRSRQKHPCALRCRGQRRTSCQAGKIARRRSSFYSIFAMEQSHLTAKPWRQVRSIANDLNLPSLMAATTRVFQAACETHDNKLFIRTIALLRIALHLLTINKSIPKQPSTIEVNHDGKGRKQNGFFDMAWTTADT